ncbi:MAG: DUF3298 and DUF4163 domain-containing protein [Psychroserpens sp.]|uniref:DUF3298 and DUF4163 domain-containing protein n=1 Tax=Psychroserpens sp. TaxID=2020870 RepID=UPI003002754F
MSNRILEILKKYSFLILILTLVSSCNEEVKIDFTEQNIESSEVTEISINLPVAEGTNEIADRINKTINKYSVNQMNLGEDILTNISIDDAVARFNYEFESFKKDFPDAAQKWEAFIDGEVTYRSPQVISIAINSYLDTGGAHGNTNVRFFNFNPQTGKLLTKKDLISNSEGLSKAIEIHLKEKIEATSKNQPAEDLFFGKGFQLPESIGYSDEGIIILYNPYEIASYAQGIIEFRIPFEEVSSFLTVN